MRPITSEQEWLSMLSTLPTWVPPQSKAVILSPHPDDETLGVGGLIANLCANSMAVTVIAITDGEHAYQDIPNLGSIRETEQVQALQQLGLADRQIIRLRLTDSAVTQAEDQLEQLILPYIDKDTYLIAPWTGDCHPDHEAAGRVATTIAQRTGIKLAYYFFWTWHHKRLAQLTHLPLAIYPLSESIYQLKQKALACYASQLTHPHGSAILPAHLLKPAQRSFEVYCHYEHE